MKIVDKNNPAQEDVQFILGTLLRVGVILSMSVVLIGGFIYLFGYHDVNVNYSEFVPDAHYAALEPIIAGLKVMDGKAIIQLGTILLIFTPITRIVFSVFSFLIERDYLYVLIGLIVLSVILFSLSNKLVG
ncbi:DUF1634 domain-containing protein [Pedobacter sp.]|uniref:DUF1634 domain-containing protein n=1 Tax=Pedobacter sp. TaxID=1411316 RepID=UPI003D7FA4C0